jgi:hypothetical protein
MNGKQYPLHPGQTHMSQQYVQIPLEEYEHLMQENKQLKEANARLAIKCKLLEQSQSNTLEHLQNTLNEIEQGKPNRRDKE